MSAPFTDPRYLAQPSVPAGLTLAASGDGLTRGQWITFAFLLFGSRS